MRIAVLMGGSSSEREISLKSGRAVAGALRRLGHEVFELDLTPELPKTLLELKPDKVFIALHGSPGEDGSVQGMLELLGIPYTGSGPTACAVCIDKDITKRVLLSEGIRTPEWETYKSEEDLRKKVFPFFPAVVKPACEGSSVGLSVVGSEEELLSRVRELLPRKVIVERFIRGRELTVGVLKGEPLPVVEIKPKRGIYDYEAKYTKGMSEYVIVDEEEVVRKLHEISLKIWELLGLRDFARIDFRLSEEGEPFFLEVNTIPGMTELSLLPMAARAKGIDFTELIRIIIS
ncbi:MAG: D-alanine--D-alanine ligase [Aquificae bacterium]|nr:D-alanine--D-alanine ligase [Aquificota bacterium]